MVLLCHFTSLLRNLMLSFLSNWKAETWLHEQAQREGWTKANKLEGRKAKEGLIGVFKNDKEAVMVEVSLAIIASYCHNLTPCFSPFFMFKSSIFCLFLCIWPTGQLWNGFRCSKWEVSTAGEGRGLSHLGSPPEKRSQHNGICKGEALCIDVEGNCPCHVMYIYIFTVMTYS